MSLGAEEGARDRRSEVSVARPPARRLGRTSSARLSDNTAADDPVEARVERTAGAARHGAGAARQPARTVDPNTGPAERCRGRHSGRSRPPPPRHSGRRVGSCSAERAGRHRRGGSLSRLQPVRHLRDRRQQHQRKQAQPAIPRKGHHLRFRSLVPMEHSQLRPDHQYRPGAGRKAPGAARRLSKRSAEGAAASRGRSGEFPAGTRAGGVSAQERRRRGCGARPRDHPMEPRNPGFHHRLDRGAEPVHGAKQSCDGRGRRVDRVGFGLPRPRRGLADPRGKRVCSGDHRRGDEAPDHWGEPLPPPAHAAASSRPPQPADVSSSPRLPQW